MPKPNLRMIIAVLKGPLLIRVESSFMQINFYKCIDKDRGLSKQLRSTLCQIITLILPEEWEKDNG